MFNNENMENGAFYQLISEFGGWMIFVGTWKLKTDLNPQGSNHGGGIPKCLSRQTLGFDSQRSEIKWTKPQKMAGVDFYHSGNCCYFHSVQLASWQICRPIIHWVLVEMPLIDLANWMDGCHYDK